MRSYRRQNDDITIPKISVISNTPLKHRIVKELQRSVQIQKSKALALIDCGALNSNPVIKRPYRKELLHKKYLVFMIFHIWDGYPPIPQIFSSSLEELRGLSFSTLGGQPPPFAPLPPLPPCPLAGATDCYSMIKSFVVSFVATFRFWPLGTNRSWRRYRQ